MIGSLVNQVGVAGAVLLALVPMVYALRWYVRARKRRKRGNWLTHLLNTPEAHQALAREIGASLARTPTNNQGARSTPVQIPRDNHPGTRMPGGVQGGSRAQRARTPGTGKPAAFNMRRLYVSYPPTVTRLQQAHAQDAQQLMAKLFQEQVDQAVERILLNSVHDPDSKRKP